MTRRSVDGMFRGITIEFAVLLVAVCALFFFAMQLWSPAHGAEAFDWDRYHERQDACLEQDRIAAACTQGYCDELALRQAQRACSPFSGLRKTLKATPD
jgi:hypothetical protein